MLDSETGRNTATHRVTDDGRRLDAGQIDQFKEPVHEGGRVKAVSASIRVPQPREVGRDDPIRGDEALDHEAPFEREAADPVQQHDRRSVAALKH